MPSEDNLFEVAISLPLFKTYTYTADSQIAGRLEAGKRVWVPFGNRRVVGYVLGAGDTGFSGQIRSIIDVLDDAPVFPGRMIAFLRWIAEYYIHPIGDVIQTAVPRGFSLTEDVALTLTPAGKPLVDNPVGLDALEIQILNHLAGQDHSLSELKRQLADDEIPQKVAGLIEKKYLRRQNRIKRKYIGMKTERHVMLREDEFGRVYDIRGFTGLSATRRKILEVLAAHGGPMMVKQLKTHVPTAGALCAKMAADGQLHAFDQMVYRDPLGESVPSDRPHNLTDEQQSVLDRLLEHLGNGFCTYLLAGVTGSGKTEIYLRLAAEALNRGQTVLVLVPEISLITQTEHRFRARFGDQVAVLHSGLSVGERFDQWMRIRDAQTPIAIGARSAIFAPFEKPGLVIVDEEHDDSYKQDHGLHYHARDLAVMRAKFEDALCVLGTATPSVQSQFNADGRKFTEVNLHRRIHGRSLPVIDVVNLKQYSAERGMKRYMSPELQTAMRETLDSGEQVLLFLNRRGFANTPICTICGTPLKCKRCDISLTWHKAINGYKCHYCGYLRSSRVICGTCNSAGIMLMGMGTERVESAVAKLFPGARSARMDRDTTKRKGALIKILKDLKNNEIDVLVGTQMVAKGHDFPNITLVGIICADLSLNLPDFRSGEKTFQLLAQVAGRAGRGERPGRVILQTYNPEHFSITTARRQNFRAFYKTEIEFRRALGYPPFSRLIRIMLSGRDKAVTARFAADLGELCQQVKKTDAGRFTAIEILGPIPAPIAKIANRFRWHMLIKGAGAGILHRFVHELCSRRPGLFQDRNVRIKLDVDPVSMM